MRFTMTIDRDHDMFGRDIWVWRARWEDDSGKVVRDESGKAQNRRDAHAALREATREAEYLGLQ